MSRFDRVPAGLRHLDELAGPLAALRADAPRLELWGRRLAEVLAGGGRLLAAGNGGSAAQAAHLTSELVGRYRDDRPAFSAIALCAESSAVTAIGNDYGYEQVFARQIEALASSGDVALAISTSGRSPNVLAGVAAARSSGIATIGLTGADGGPLSAAVDICIEVPSDATPRIQEAHTVVAHILCELVERDIA